MLNDNTMVWFGIAMFSVIMFFVSFYEVPRLIRTSLPKRTKIYITITILAIWGFLMIFALAKAGV
ncbi:hypothetical protein [Aquella oligotrophica]|uniref:Uncharacterized protein n=1 Tax=Aquella oligotrophica TaxID=2067065 RepID=A0A2I7N6K2_9NEIS|nr:hypothetical protein [Aquella oligotrophica]AUR52106.1 hypothetical protein CUN60_07255 [Aquella oligotrophica]